MTHSSLTNLSNGKNNEESLLFSAKLISPNIQAQLPPGYTLRPLRRDDYARGFIKVLGQLSITGQITQPMFEERFDLMKRLGTYFLVCIETSNTIVACATLIVEHKFLHHCGQSAHIEDVVVDDTQRGKRLGIRLIDQLKYMSEELGCYKIILNCTQHNIPFYEKCDMKVAQVQMTRYLRRED
ncbi:glucosamine 6-phosphate N-acetyltransferase-like protein [Dichotomocladium elegans]|nr:glucosamine 6-phosphate N-acetyltransferase-like protein [Dichotomocladium elegans]